MGQHKLEMTEQAEKFKQLIDSSERILITSHVSPDPDAVASLLLMGTALKKNFSNKQVTMVLEEEPMNLGFLDGYGDIEFGPLLGALEKHRPEMLILLDGNNYKRASRSDGDKVRQYIDQCSVKTAIIDHHETNDKDETDIFINNLSPAAVQTVYELLFHELGLKKPNGSAQTAMVGFFADTGGFVYLKAGTQGKVFEFAEELVAHGASVEQIKSKLSQYSKADMKALSELAANVTHTDNYSYSFISDEFINEWSKTHSLAELQIATGVFLDEFIRNIDGHQWGFIVYRNILQGNNIYSASFRAVSGTKDVAQIAQKLGGGGHKPAAGAKFEAGSVQEAIDKVKQVIAGSDK